MRHIIWDWNGTLLDDRQLVVDALNAVLVDVGVAPVDLDTYQRAYTRPLDAFYARLLGRPVAPQEWPHIDTVYYAHYVQGVGEVGLAHDALEALQTVESAGARQSLLSMYRHDALVPLVERFGLHDRFVRVDGDRQGGGGPKAPLLAEHLRHLDVDGSRGGARQPPTSVVMIGDALDDARAAASVGIPCVLYDGGSHPRRELEATGMPVASSLQQAVALAGIVA